MFYCVFMLRRHVSGVFMFCDCHGVRDYFHLSFHIVLCTFCKVLEQIKYINKYLLWLIWEIAVKVVVCVTQNELSRVMEEQRQAEEAQRNCEAARHRLEVELRDMAVRLEQAEHVGLREGKRLIAKLQSRVR